MFIFQKDPLIIKKINTTQKEVFLTFDDGPDPDLTPAVLELLDQEQAFATFFVIGEKGRAHPSLLQKILLAKHSVFSHSVDHSYRLYFRGKNRLKLWIAQSLEDLEKQTALRQNVFRPPAGVLTPPLVMAARDLQIPLILWNQRFYDATLPWTEEKALRNAQTITPGDIVLLHDRQKPQNRNIFLNSLSKYLQEMRRRGYSFSSLSNSIIQNEVHNVHRF